MDFGKAFSFPFEDQDWIQKLAITGVIFLIPILGQIIVGGWMIEVIRRVIRNDPQPLPDWSEFGDFLVKGLQAFVIGLVYSLPIILLSFCAQLPTIFLQDSGTSEDVLWVLIACMSCVSVLLGILVGLFVPAALAKFAESGQLGAAFRFGEVFGLVRAAPGAYVLVLLGSFLSGLLAMLGLAACVIGVFFTMAYATAVNGHLYGQAYNEAMSRSGMQQPAY